MFPFATAFSGCQLDSACNYAPVLHRYQCTDLILVVTFLEMCGICKHGFFVQSQLIVCMPGFFCLCFLSYTMTEHMDIQSHCVMTLCCTAVTVAFVGIAAD